LRRRFVTFLTLAFFCIAPVVTGAAPAQAASAVPETTEAHAVPTLHPNILGDLLVCDHRNFTGYCEILTGTDDDLPVYWQNHLISLRSTADNVTFTLTGPSGTLCVDVEGWRNIGNWAYNHYRWNYHPESVRC